METTLTTDKNNFFCGGQHARRFKNAAKFRGEKEDVVLHVVSVVSNKLIGK
jgi:hypothetical protein